jgi:hypothetical protein
MRNTATLILLSLTVGCAAQSPAPETVATGRRPVVSGYADSAASALVFDVPLASRGPALDLSREDRQASAFIGYETGVATSFYLRSDDRQSDTWGDQIERRMLSAKTGVTYR